MTTDTTAPALEPTGLDAVRAALATRDKAERSISWLAGKLGLSRGAVYQWGDKVPEEYLEPIATLLGVSPRLLRPDLAKLMEADKA